MADNRQSRTQEQRVAEPVHDISDDWDDDSLLSTKNIPARPGFVQRWVRTEVRGEADQSNVFKKMNRGWKPRLLDTVEKGAFVPNIDFNGINVIGIHGSILMERPEALHKKESAMVKNDTNLQMSAVKNDLYRLGDNGAFKRPEFDEKTQVSRGRVPSIDD